MPQPEPRTDQQKKHASSAAPGVGGAKPDLDAWYEKYGDQLLRFCQSRLGPTAGEDVFQQVWLKVARKPEQFTGGNARAWLFQIARTSIIDFVRKKKPESQSETVEGSSEMNATSVLEQMVVAEEQQRFRECLDKLPPEKQKLIHLRVTGQSYKQISEILSIAIGTVGSQYNRICEQLRTCVGAEPGPATG